MALSTNSLIDYDAGLGFTGGLRGSQDDVVIAVMGSTGTGKSSFIRLLTGDRHVKVGSSLESETSDVQVIRFRDRTSGCNVTIIDTPGFDDSRAGVTDTDILKKITNFLLDEYDMDRKLTGLIYLTRISDPRFGGQSSRNLRMFQNLCGTKTYKNIVVLTTFWDQVATKDEGARREEQLKSSFFKSVVDGGACFMRHDRTIESARQVLGHMFTLVPANLRIQEEIRVEGKSLEDTAAGSVHREEVERIIAKHKKEVAELKSEVETIKNSNKALRQELEEERSNLQQKLARWENERLELKKGLDDERKSRERLEAEAAKEKEDREKWRSEQERSWSTRFDSHGKEHDAVLHKLQAELDKEKKARQEGEVIESPPPYQAGYPDPPTQGTSTASPISEFRFVYTDKYPPYLESIPSKFSTGIFEIFDFTSLLQTSAMLFLQPENLFQSRKLAPDWSKNQSMQDLVNRNQQLHIKSRQTGSTIRRDMYFSKNIGHRDDWYTDAVFGQQQFIGTNPTTITLAPPRWINIFKSASDSQQLADVTKLLTDDPGSLFIQDYSDFRSLVGLSPSAEITTEDRYGCSSVELFHLEPEGKLHPLAIILDYKGTMKESVTIFNRRITSKAPGNESEDWPWRYAKMCAQVSDWFLHEVVIHLVNTHLVEEVIIVSVHRTFDPTHIVFTLLEPHWNTTLSLNKAARETLVPKIINNMTGFSPSQTHAFLNACYRRFDWTGSYVPNDLRRRGFPMEELDKLKYHNYGYARNIARMWVILRKFVSSVLTEAYPGGDMQVANDRSISAFCRDVRARNGGQLASFPDVKTLNELIDFVTMCIHIASPQHTAVNYLQQYYQTFVPNKPSALYKPLPRSLAELKDYKEVDILLALPIHRPKDWLLMAQVPYLLSFEVPEEGTILNYATTTSDKSSTPILIRRAARVLKGDLEVFISTVAQNSKALDDQGTPYLVLDPSKTAISILI